MRQKSEAQLGVTEAVRQFDDRRRRAFFWGTVTAILSWLIVFLFYAFLKSLPYKGTLIDILSLLAQSVFSGGSIIFGYLVYRKLVTPKSLLVWLRRFRSDYGKRMRFHRCLGQACSAMVSPITIQDSSFRTSIFSAALRAWIMFPLLGFLWIIGLAIVDPIHHLALPASIASSKISYDVLLALWTALYGWGAWSVVKRSGFRTLTGQDGVIEAGRRFQSLKSGGEGPGIGLEVLRCHDSIWKDVVSLALSQADTVIIDITEPTENVLWELAQAREQLGEDSILLVCEDSSELEPSTSEVETFTYQDIIQSKDFLMMYPAIQAPIGPGRGRQYKELTKKLREEIAIRMAKT